MVIRSGKVTRKHNTKMSSSAGCTDIHVSEAKCDIDFPAGRCGGHAPTGVRWTAPKAGTVDISGAVWKLRNNAPADLTLWINDRKVIDRAPITGDSSQPLDFNRLMAIQGTEAKLLQDIAVKPGDEILALIGGNDFAGLDLKIKSKSDTWDLAKDFSLESNPSGPWAYGQIADGKSGKPILKPYDTVNSDFDPDGKRWLGKGQPSWTSRNLAPHLSMMKSKGLAEANNWEVRFTAGRTIYVEALDSGCWVSRYWSADGRINIPYEKWSVDAFQLELDRQQLPNSWALVSATEDSKTERGARHFVVELANKVRPVTVKMHTLLDDTPVMTRWLEIGNTSKKPMALTSVYPWTNQLAADEEYYHDPSGPKPFDHAFTLGHFAKANHCWEGWFQWQPLAAGTTVIGCDYGQCYDDPFFIIRNEGTGNHLIGSYAWSANWQMELECKEQNVGPLGNQHTLRFKIGPSSKAALRVISPGEIIATPTVHMALMAGDLDTTVQAMHDHLRHSVLPASNKKRSYRIQYSLPGCMGYTAPAFGNPAGCTEISIKENIDIAAALGVELFIMDADWWEVQGDWSASPTRLPHGLEPLVDYAHGKGMLFGLYGEIERAYGEGCKIAREHPDWIDWYPPYRVLNMTRPEVAQYAEKELIGMIERYKIDLYRLDFNTPTNAPCEGIATMRDGVAECNFWRYYDAVYSMFERIHQKYPDLMLQQCACGGGRNDLGIASRFHEQYLTDGLRLPHAIQSYSGQTLSLPPESIVIALEADGGHGIGSPGNFDTNLRVVFTLSTPWIYSGFAAPSVKDLSLERRERFLHYGNIYKNFIRPILPTCRTFHHAPVSARGGVGSSGWFAMEFAAHDRTKGWATIVRIGMSDTDTYVLKPRGLDRGKTYKVTFDSTGEIVRVDGLNLSREDLAIRLENLIASELVMFEEM